jgi:diacylglycerol kinase (CTP)
MNSTPQLKPRSDIHFARKIWHFTGVIFVLICYHNMSRGLGLFILAFFAILAVVVESTRQHSPNLNALVIKAFKPFMRENEKTGWTGLTYLVLGALIIVAFFPRPIVTMSLLFLAVADPAASYFGIRFGKDKLFGRKSLQGSLAAFFVCTVVSIGYYFTHNLMTDRIIIVGILSGLAGAIAEVVPVGKLDDNLVLPVLSAALRYLILYLVGGF